MQKVQGLGQGLLLLLHLLGMTLLFQSKTLAQDRTPLVRIANLQIDSAQLDSYKAVLKEEIETAVRVEPGVLTLYAVSETGHPTHVTVFEIYASQDAYQAHLATAHFKKYKAATKDMVKSLELSQHLPIVLATKPKL
jgi:quinol monooxygenase YgiN